MFPAPVLNFYALYFWVLYLQRPKTIACKFAFCGGTNEDFRHAIIPIPADSKREIKHRRNNMNTEWPTVTGDTRRGQFMTFH